MPALQFVMILTFLARYPYSSRRAVIRLLVYLRILLLVCILESVRFTQSNGLLVLACLYYD